MKMTKGETNDLLYAVGNDNPKIGAILKLIYTYGKDAKTVLTMKWSQIDFYANTIRFKNHDFPLAPEIKEDLMKIKSDSDYPFLEDATEEGLENEVDILRKRIRYYLTNNVKNLEIAHRIRHSGLSITDLRKLRGQHLIMDGVTLDVVMKLYCQEAGTSTQFKKYLEYDSLMDELHPCRDIEGIFRDHTDLNIGSFDAESKNLNLEAADLDGDECSINIYNDTLTFSDDVSDELKAKIIDVFNSSLLKSLEMLKDSEVKYAGELSFIRI